MKLNPAQSHHRQLVPQLLLALFFVLTLSITLTAANGPFQKDPLRTKPLDESQPIFLPAEAFLFGYGLDATAIALADLNTDGKQDLIAVGGELLALPGNGDGTFRFEDPYFYRGHYPYRLAVTDVNGDGKADLILASGTLVDILIGNGDGTFYEGGTFLTGGNDASSIAVADLNKDGKIDIVVANGDWEDQIGILLGNGDGTFRDPITYPSLGASRVTIADVNRDGNPDLIVANWSPAPGDDPNGLLGVLLGNGDGTFQPGVTYAAGGYYPLAIAAKDVNGDGNPDLLILNVTNSSGSTPGVVGVLLGIGDGTFQPVVDYTPGPTYVNALIVGDVNLDDIPDLLISSGNTDDAVDGTVSLMRGNGDGTFQPSDNYDSGGVAAGPMALADLNGDGRPDVLVADRRIRYAHGYAPGFAVLLNNAGAPPTTTTLVSDQNPTQPRETPTYTASVSAQSGGTVTGTIVFRDGSRVLATVPLSANQASYSQKYKRPGIHPISATYSGDLQNGGSTSSILTQYVQDYSTTLLVTSGSPSYVGQSVTFTATVIGGSSGYYPPDGGLVSFYDGASLLGTVGLQSGVASVTTSSLSAKKHAIKAAYLGGEQYKPSHKTVGQLVQKNPTTTTLTSNQNPSHSGDPVTFTATVASTGALPPTGSVTFRDGQSALGSAPLSGGIATLTKSRLAIGAHAVTARYQGDAASAMSISLVLTQVVQ